jgi:hypothetical protein
MGPAFSAEMGGAPPSPERTGLCIHLQGIVGVSGATASAFTAIIRHIGAIPASVALHETGYFNLASREVLRSDNGITEP